VALGAGADGVIDGISQAVLDTGDEIVCGWPSFPSFVIYALKQGATATRVPLRDHRYDLDALLEAIGPRTKLVYVCNPNNPTGTMSTRAEVGAFLDRLPEHVLPVLDQAYFEYIVDPDYPDGVQEYFRAGRRVVVLRTFSKIFGLAGLRLGYGIGPADVVTQAGKVRRPFDLSTPAQAAALASLDAPAELERRRNANAAGLEELRGILAAHGFSVAGPAVANFVFAEVGEDAAPLFEELLRLGVIVRPARGFGAPGAIRVTVGTPEDHAFLADALGRLRAPQPVA
jgi:histidinol-phosphate aminotransferase